MERQSTSKSPLHPVEWLALILGMMAILACTLAVPTPTPTLPVAEPTSPTLTPSSMTVQIFLIALEDNGVSGRLIGCNDSSVPVTLEVPYSEDEIQAALEALLAIEDQYYGESGLYNALYQSDLQVESVAVEDGLATVNLSGALILGGVCDNPRVEAQIHDTVGQFPGVTEIAVFINGQKLEDLLSLR